MKLKALLLVILATAVLLSFTVVSSSNKDVKASTGKADTSGGLAMEDRNQWN